MSGSETFGDTSFWDEYGTTPDYVERRALIRSLIPPETRLILDIGCGKGDVINALSHKNPDLSVVGIDPFLEAMRFLEVPAVQAVLPKIPFVHRAFELVMCLQVLEHLDTRDFDQAIIELQRLAKNYVIVGVPYKENLQTLEIRCSACGQISHAYGHVRRFEKKHLVNLFPDFTVRKMVLAGVRQRRRSKLGVLIEHRVAGLYYQPTDFVCPYCHHNSPADSTSPLIVGWSARFFTRFLTLLSPRMPYWIITLYERKSRESGNE